MEVVVRGGGEVLVIVERHNSSWPVAAVGIDVVKQGPRCEAMWLCVEMPIS